VYAKLFTSIYQGTLRGNSHGLLVFTNLLAHCDKNGYADIHPRAIAEEVGLTVEQVKAAIDTLESADDESRSPELDGRRIVRMDEHRAWGWNVVNYVKYRAIRDEEDRREQNRLSQERWRNKHKPPSEPVSQRKPQSAHTEAEAEADTEKVKTPSPRKRGSAGVAGFDLFWKAYPRKIAKAEAAKAFDKIAPSVELLDQMIDAIEKQRTCEQWVKDGGQFIPYPASWLNKARWLDEVAPSEPHETPRQRAAREFAFKNSGGILGRAPSKGTNNVRLAEPPALD
jgi:hypothetical protein